MSGSVESLPTDILVHLLLRVPAESALECKLVCKRWKTIICSETQFYNMHHTHQLTHLHESIGDKDNMLAKVEPSLLWACRLKDDRRTTLLFYGGQLSDRISNSINKKYSYKQNLKRICHPRMHDDYILCRGLVVSCNGLICICVRHHSVIDPIFICNPLTKEYVYLPESTVKDRDDRSKLLAPVACGFGYVRSTNEYKVVRIFYHHDIHQQIVEVYTLGSDCGWRAKVTSTTYCPFQLRTTTVGTYANEAIYWTAEYNIEAFNLADEEFQLLSVPVCINDDRASGLVVLGGYLCVYTNKSRMEIWSFKGSRNSRETWCMKFDIDYKGVIGSRRLKPILLTKNKEIIFTSETSVLYSYDRKTATFKKISDDDKASTDYFASIKPVAHINTFVSLKDIGEKSNRYM